VIFTNQLGRSVDVDLPAVLPELLAMLHAADVACGASTTEPEVERLRYSRSEFMKAIDRAEKVRVE
jgi:hypothetical protein